VEYYLHAVLSIFIAKSVANIVIVDMVWSCAGAVLTQVKDLVIGWNVGTLKEARQRHITENVALGFKFKQTT